METKKKQPRPPAAKTGVMGAILASNMERLIALRYKGLEKTARVMKLAGDAGVGHGTVQRCLNEQASPTLDTVEKLALALGVSVYQILLANLDPDHPQKIPGTESAELSRYAKFKLTRLRALKPALANREIKGVGRVQE